MAEFKQFLYAFCGKRKVQPAYAYEEEGTGFYCEVREFHNSAVSEYDRRLHSLATLV